MHDQIRLMREGCLCQNHQITRRESAPWLSQNRERHLFYF